MKFSRIQVSRTFTFRKRHFLVSYATLNIWFKICSGRSNIGYDKLVMVHEMLSGHCPKKLKNRFACKSQVSYYQTRNSDIM